VQGLTFSVITFILLAFLVWGDKGRIMGEEPYMKRTKRYTRGGPKRQLLRGKAARYFCAIVHLLFLTNKKL